MTDDPEFVMVRRDKLEAVARWFREYETSHAAKGSIEGDWKARRNAERAEFVEALISAVPPAPSVSEEAAPSPKPMSEERYRVEPGSNGTWVVTEYTVTRKYHTRWHTKVGAESEAAKLNAAIIQASGGRK
jgi:hypothetical protein